MGPREVCSHPRNCADYRLLGGFVVLLDQVNHYRNHVSLPLGEDLRLGCDRYPWVALDGVLPKQTLSNPKSLTKKDYANLRHADHSPLRQAMLYPS